VSSPQESGPHQVTAGLSVSANRQCAAVQRVRPNVVMQLLVSRLGAPMVSGKAIRQIVRLLSSTKSDPLRGSPH
jgi:hypothetical protein